MSLEIFQTLGAVVGFVAGAITLYDRLLRYKPFVSIYAEVEGMNALPYLRLTNAAPYDIFVDDISIEPPLIALSQQTTAQAMIDVITNANITATIKEGQSAHFRIVESPSSTDAAKRTQDRIKVKVRWYRSLPSIIRPLASTLETSISDIQERKRGAILSPASEHQQNTARTSNVTARRPSTGPKIDVATLPTIEDDDGPKPRSC
jgi:hypothetical protein